MFKRNLENVLLEHDELTCVLPFVALLSLGYLLKTQSGGWVGWMAHKIFVTAHRPIPLSQFFI